MVVLVELSYLQQSSNTIKVISSGVHVQPRRVRAISTIFHQRTERPELEPTHKQQCFSHFIAAIAGNVGAKVHVPFPKKISFDWRQNTRE